MISLVASGGFQRRSSDNKFIPDMNDLLVLINHLHVAKDSINDGV